MQDKRDTPRQLFDTGLLAARRARARRLGFDGHGDFLHREVAEELAERLEEVTRSFADACVVSWAGEIYRDALGDRFGTIRCVEASEVLPVEPESCDLIVSGLELHAANDPVGQLVQMRRALRPDGLLLVAMFGGQTLAELRASLAEAEVEITGGLAPRVAPMGEIRDLGGLLQRAGFAMPVADSRRIDVTYDHALGLMTDLRRMGETNVLGDRHRGGLRRDVLARACEIYAQNFAAADGRVSATFEVVFLTGWAPGPDQPVALRPGSATARLADALGTEETRLPDQAPAQPGQTRDVED